MSVPAALVEKVLAAQRAGEGGLTIPEILSPDEMAFMQRVWPSIRVAADFSHPNWASLGYPGGPPLSPQSYAAMAYVWPRVRVAADFSHPNWDLVPVPYNIIGVSAPIPELPEAPSPVNPTVGPAPIINVPITSGSNGGGGPLSFEPLPMPDEESGGAVPVPIQAGLFSLPSILTIAGAILFFSIARGARAAGVKKRRRRRRR